MSMIKKKSSLWAADRVNFLMKPKFEQRKMGTWIISGLCLGKWRGGWRTGVGLAVTSVCSIFLIIFNRSSFISPLKDFELQKCPTSGDSLSVFIKHYKDAALIPLLVKFSVHCQLSWMLKEFQFHPSSQIHLFPPDLKHTLTYMAFFTADLPRRAHFPQSSWNSPLS